MAIPHARPAETIDVRPLGAALAASKTLALFKSEGLEVIRLVLAAGASLPLHKVPGDITLQCIEGRIDVKTDATTDTTTDTSTDDASHILDAGQMLFLAGDTVHGVLALEDASALVTIALKR